MGNMCADHPHDKNITTKRKKELASDFGRRWLIAGEYEENNEVKEIKEFLTLTSQNTESFNLEEVR